MSRHAAAHNSAAPGAHPMFWQPAPGQALPPQHFQPPPWSSHQHAPALDHSGSVWLPPHHGGAAAHTAGVPNYGAALPTTATLLHPGGQPCFPHNPYLFCAPPTAWPGAVQPPPPPFGAGADGAQSRAPPCAAATPPLSGGSLHHAQSHVADRLGPVAYGKLKGLLMAQQLEYRCQVHILQWLMLQHSVLEAQMSSSGSGPAGAPKRKRSGSGGEDDADTEAARDPKAACTEAAAAAGAAPQGGGNNDDSGGDDPGSGDGSCNQRRAAAAAGPGSRETSPGDEGGAPQQARLAAVPGLGHLRHSVATGNLCQLAGAANGSQSTFPAASALDSRSTPAATADAPLLVHPDATQCGGGGAAAAGGPPADVAAAFAAAAAAAAGGGAEKATCARSAGVQESAAAGTAATPPSRVREDGVIDGELLTWLQAQLPRPWRPDAPRARSSSRSSRSTGLTWQPEELLALLANPEMLRQGFTFEEASQVNIAQISAIKDLHAQCGGGGSGGGAAGAGTAAAAAAAAAALGGAPETLVSQARALRDSADSVGRSAAAGDGEAQLCAMDSAVRGFRTVMGATRSSFDASRSAAGAAVAAGDAAAAEDDDDPAVAVGGAYAGAMGAAHKLPHSRAMVPWAPPQEAAPQSSARAGISDTGSEVSDMHGGGSGDDDGCGSPGGGAGDPDKMCSGRGSNVPRHVKSAEHGSSPAEQRGADASARSFSGALASGGHTVGRGGAGAFARHCGSGAGSHTGREAAAAEAVRQTASLRKRSEGGGDNNAASGARVNLGGNH